MEIKMIKTSDVIPYINNPRKNDAAVDKVASSIKNFGFKVPIVIDRKGEIVTGHTRVKAAKKLGITEIPCIIADDLTEAQVKAFRIADNRVAEESEWDMELLNIEIEGLEDFSIGDLGFNDGELDDMLGESQGESQEVVEDDFDEEPPENPISKRGDIWLLGRHRLMCGDSTTDDVDMLMDGKKAHACWTDPPYNMNYGNINHEKFKQREIQNDNMPAEDFKKFCYAFTLKIKENVLGCVYTAGPPGPYGRIMFSALDELLHCSTTIIWNKDQFTLGRGKYQNKYEPIWFGWVENGTRFTSDRKLTNVWDIPRPKKSELHPTMKPMDLIVKSINHSTMKTDLVLDIFGGSGSTLIACEQTNRTCYMMELDEKYIDVIVNRYINFKQSDEDVYLIRNGEKIPYSEVDK